MSPVTAFVLAALAFQDPTHAGHGPMAEDEQAMDHAMFELRSASGWRLTGMAQVFPILTLARSAEGDGPLDDSGFYLTQGAAMVNLESPSRTFALRVTPNLEGLTQGDGELTFGAWGEGFIDSRHPHTVVHEAMVSLNLWDTGVGDVSLSAGKGFAPYGTDDPMSRPSVKYPTNHHLSQILERFTVNAVWLRGGWGLEAGLFGGGEPEGPYDFSNIDSFGDSWSVRASRRFGASAMTGPAWEASASLARVKEAHHDGDEHGSGATRLFNAALRHASTTMQGNRRYALVEFSVSDPAEGKGYWSLLAEGGWRNGVHEPYARVERATRPEYPREAASGDEFFRYDHDASPIGATAWTIVSVGYGLTATTGSFSVRPFVEGQIVRASPERGGVEPETLFGARTLTGVTIGARVFLGGDPMRMGAYGVLDPMTRMGR